MKQGIENHSVPKMHLFRNSYAVPFGINPNKLLFDSKRDADNLK